MESVMNIDGKKIEIAKVKYMSDRADGQGVHASA